MLSLRRLTGIGVRGTELPAAAKAIGIKPPFSSTSVCGLDRPIVSSRVGKIPDLFAFFDRKLSFYGVPLGVTKSTAIMISRFLLPGKFSNVNVL